MCIWTFSRLRKCTKSLYVYVCVLEHNASTLELLRQMREKRRKKKKGEASEEETQLLKPCVQSADNQNRGWDPKCIMGDPTWLAVLLLSALSFSSLLWSVLAYFPEWRDAVMLTPPPGPSVISVCLCNKDWRIFGRYLGASWTQLSHVDMDHICTALVSALGS